MHQYNNNKIQNQSKMEKLKIVIKNSKLKIKIDFIKNDKILKFLFN